MPLVGRATKAPLPRAAATAVADNLGLDATGLVARLGIGGLAVALAARKAGENPFGGLAPITGRPVRARDSCRVGAWIGTMEHAELRATRIRTRGRTVVAIPSAAIAGMELENLARRERIWCQRIANPRYETTPNQLRWLLVAPRRRPASHPMVSPDPARVRIVGLGAHSVDGDLFASVETREYDPLLAVREDLLLRVLDRVQESGSDFACPARTLCVAPDPGIDAGRRAAAGERVKVWYARPARSAPGAQELVSVGGAESEPAAGPVASSSPSRPRSGTGTHVGRLPSS